MIFFANGFNFAKCITRFRNIPYSTLIKMPISVNFLNKQNFSLNKDFFEIEVLF